MPDNTGADDLQTSGGSPEEVTAADIAQQIRRAAADLLGRGEVNVVLGYCASWHPEVVTPCFLTSTDEVDRLIFNEHCTHNLARYLVGPDGWLTAPYRIANGKPRLAVVAIPGTLRAIAGLIQEHQFERTDVVILGIVDGSPAGVEPDTQVGSIPQDTERAEWMQRQLADLEAMTAEERSSWWEAHFTRCVRCYACRQVCPFCYCDQCIADENQPQWIDRSSSPANNRMWITIRAFHLIGRCVDCGECDRACPAEIPLGLLNYKMRLDLEETFGYVAGMDVDATPALFDLRAAVPNRLVKR